MQKNLHYPVPAAHFKTFGNFTHAEIWRAEKKTLMLKFPTLQLQKLFDL